MTLSVQSYPKFRSVIPSTGAANNQGYVWTYAAGTTNPQATYADAESKTQNDNPVQLDSNGEAFIWILNTNDAAYDFAVYDANDNLLQTILDIQQVAIVNNNVSFTGNLSINNNSIIDAATKKYIKFTATASAANWLTITNSATGTGPTLAVDGGDTNIDLNLAAKGTGKVNVGGAGSG